MTIKNKNSLYKPLNEKYQLITNKYLYVTESLLRSKTRKFLISFSISFYSSLKKRNIFLKTDRSEWLKIFNYLWMSFKGNHSNQAWLFLNLIHSWRITKVDIIREFKNCRVKSGRRRKIWTLMRPMIRCRLKKEFFTLSRRRSSCLITKKWK